MAQSHRLAIAFGAVVLVALYFAAGTAPAQQKPVPFQPNRPLPSIAAGTWQGTYDGTFYWGSCAGGAHFTYRNEPVSGTLSFVVRREGGSFSSGGYLNLGSPLSVSPNGLSGPTFVDAKGHFRFDDPGNHCASNVALTCDFSGKAQTNPASGGGMTAYGPIPAGVHPNDAIPGAAMGKWTCGFDWPHTTYLPSGRGEWHAWRTGP